jgi:hypothetical protein
VRPEVASVTRAARGQRCTLRHWLTSLAVAAASQFACRHAGAETSVGVHYAAVRECPTPEAFLDAVRARGIDKEVERRERELATYHVEISHRRGVFVGRLDAAPRSGTAVRRSLSDANCEELTKALALITALAIDPTASETKVTASPARPPRPPVRPRPLQRAAVLRGAADSKSARVGVRAGVAWHVITALSPAPGWKSGDLFIEIAYAFGPKLAATARGSFIAGTSRDEPASGIHVDYRWFLARAGLCPVELSVVPRVRVSGCAALQAGELRADGYGVALQRARSARLLWTAADATMRGALSLWPLWGFEVEGGVALPMRSAEFVVSPPRTVVHDPPAVGALWRAGIAATFP